MITDYSTKQTPDQRRIHWERKVIELRSELEMAEEHLHYWDTLASHAPLMKVLSPEGQRI
jgi:putative alpha-1,2-mannosidase